MTKKILSIFILSVACLALLAIIISACILQNISYHQLVDGILAQLHREDLKPIITNTYFTTAKFKFVQKMSLVLGGVSFFVLSIIFYKWRTLYLFLQKLIQRVLITLNAYFSEIHQSTVRGKMALGVLLLFILFRSIYYAMSFYIQHDEAWNYNYFLSQSFFYSVFAYNNYPLHNIITNIILFFLPDNTFTLRLSVILFGILSSLSVFIIIKRIFKLEWLALCAVALFASLPISIYYMLYARGVMLNMFFLLWCFYFIYQFSVRKLSKFEIVIFALTNGLAVYSMLTHFYFIAFSSLALLIHFILQKKYLAIGQLALYGLLSILFSLLLLTPMFIGTGIGSGIQAGIHPGTWLSLHDLPYHCYASFYSGIWFGFYPIILFNLILLFIKKYAVYRFLIILNLVLLLSVPIIYQLTKVYPPERTLCYLLLPIVVSLVLLFIILQQKTSIIICIGLCLVLNISTYNSGYMNWSKKLDTSVKKLSDTLMHYHIAILYNTQPEFNYFVPGMLYYHQLQNSAIQYYTNQPGSTRFKALKDVEHIDAVVRKASPHSKDSCIYLQDGIGVYLQP